MKPRSARSSLVLLLSMTFSATGLGCPPAVAAPPSQPTTEANITRLTTGLLEHSQLAHHPFDSELAGTLLDRYLDALDPSRSVFLQSDVDELAGGTAALSEATRARGDDRRAQAIFARYLERLEQRASYLTKTLHTASFDFTGHDVYAFNREKARRPRDLSAAQNLWLQQLRAAYLDEKLDDKRPEEIVSTLAKRYAQQLKTMKGLGKDEVLEGYLDTLAHVYDPHSDYFGHEQMESFSIAMSLSLVGIGATLEDADGYCQIRDLVAGGPAARSGLLKTGDRIVGVAQAGEEPVDVVNMPLSRVVDLIRGPKGSTVSLSVIPAADGNGSPPRTTSLVRDEIKLADQEAKARIVDLPIGNGTTERLGVIDLPSFYSGAGGPNGATRRSATDDVARLLTKLKLEHVQGIVLDVRRNGGGSLEEAISLTGLFIKKGAVVQTRDQKGDVEVDNDPDPSVLYDGPLVVLTSRLSASATEIMAGALQDYGRAVVVGDTSTFGKGTVQTVVPLAHAMDENGLAHAYDPGALKVTIAKFYRPSGASTQLRGVASDIVLPSTSDVSEISESTMKNPLPWDTIAPASYEHLDRVAPYIAALRQRSSERVATEKSFAYLAHDIAKVRQSLATKTVSLNEAERRKELAEEKARRSAHEKEEQAAYAAEPKTYEITLENLALPGLPAPIDFTKNVHPVAKTGASLKNDLDEEKPSSADDTDLKEGMQILKDYINLLQHP